MSIFLMGYLKDLIYNFVNYVQSLPDKTGRDFYVNTALLRALWALESYLKKLNVNHVMMEISFLMLFFGSIAFTDR